MKKYKKSETAAFLEEFQKRLSAVNKAVQKKATIETDAVDLEKEITALGKPNYKEAQKFLVLNATRERLKACEEALEEQKMNIGEKLVSLAELVGSACAMAAAILQEVVSNRLETVTSCLLPFSANRSSAETLARQTDACRGAGILVADYSQRAERIRKFTGLAYGEKQTLSEYADQELGRILKIAQDCERVLTESVSKAPDLMQFVPFTSDSEEKGPAEKTVAASARKGEIREPQSAGPDLSSVEQAAAAAQQQEGNEGS